MTTAKPWAALAIASLATFSACSDVESCLQGVDPGCLGSAPDDSGNCKFGLVRSADGLTCIQRGEDGGSTPTPRPDAGTPTPDAGQSNCSCASGQLCRQDGTCVNLCTPVANPPTPQPVLLPCRAPMGVTESFARAALAACVQTCSHRAAYCGTPCDPTVECTQLLASTAARAACAGADDQACAIALCERQRDLPCAQQQCPVGSTPSCTGTTCSNNCDMPEYNNDGICDDGDPSNAISYVCEYGTDCGDCGPRRGSAPPFKLDLGDVCADPQQCGGNLYGVKSSTGWCVPAANNQSYSRCIPDCSNGKTCPAGHSCVGIAADEDGPNGPLPQVQFTDYNDGTPVFGCFPTQCGG
ncbi:MAG: hypothetical protein ABW352_20570 [Polyangiales bacterium]